MDGDGEVWERDSVRKKKKNKISKEKKMKVRKRCSCFRDRLIKKQDE